MMPLLSRAFFLASIIDFLLVLVLVISGFPAEVAGHRLPFKNLRKPVIALVLLLAAGIWLDPRRETVIARWRERFTRWTQGWKAVWVLAVIYSFLFLWQQLTEFMTLEINFLPFSFYDYMFYFLQQGKVNYTGLLHTFYHLNNILLFLYPVWLICRTPLLLVLIYGPLAAAAVFPLFGLARKLLRDGPAALLICFIYLNYRYLQNVLIMNFSVEIFYPLFLFSALYFALERKWIFYYAAVLLGLMVKEDSFMYFSALGALVFFMAGRKHGIATITVSLAYFAFLLKVFIPLTGNNVFAEDLNNFGSHGDSVGGIAGNLLSDPAAIFRAFFGDAGKLRTYFNLFGRLLFLPLFSPSVLLVLAPIFPLFFHHTGRDTDFIQLNFHYAAPVIPFVFIALVMGLGNVLKRTPRDRRNVVFCGVMLGLLLLNGGGYSSRRIRPENLESLRWARTVPRGANLVTHGHLLPYVGYREYNYYFAEPFERPEHKAHEPYVNADCYLIDLNVNLYPMDRAFFEKKLEKLRQDGRYSLVREGNGRFLFKRKDLPLG